MHDLFSIAQLSRVWEKKKVRFLQKRAKNLPGEQHCNFRNVCTVLSSFEFHQDPFSVISINKTLRSSRPWVIYSAVSHSIIDYQIIYYGALKKYTTMYDDRFYFLKWSPFTRLIFHWMSKTNSQPKSQTEHDAEVLNLICVSHLVIIGEKNGKRHGTKLDRALSTTAAEM